MAEAITIARPYATAVFRLAKEKKALAKWSDELALIAAVSDNAQVKALIDDPKLFYHPVSLWEFYPACHPRNLLNPLRTIPL